MIALVFCFIGVWGIGFGCGVLYLMHKDEKPKSREQLKKDTERIFSDMFGQEVKILE